MTSPSSGFYIADVKWRNQLLALFCLLVFAAFGVLYFRYWVVQKPFGIILFIGEGLSADRLAVLRTYAVNAETPLTIDTLSYTALLKNYSSDHTTPDSAAAATAVATGTKVPNGTLAVDAKGNALANLLELARASGRTTGLVTDGRLTSATAAAFYAHTTATADTQELARSLVESGNIDIVLGGGSVDFLPQTDGGVRADTRDLLQEADDADYDVVRTRTELEAVPWWRWPKVFGVFGSAELTHGDEIGPETRQPSLSDMVRRGVELLQIHRGGYLLVVDAALMRKAAEQNDVEGTLAAMREFDRAISVALRFAGTKTTVFVTGDVALGGLKFSGFPSRSAGRAQAGIDNSLGEVRATWATGPNGGAPVSSASPAPQTDPTAAPSPEAIGEGAFAEPEPALSLAQSTAPEPPTVSEPLALLPADTPMLTESPAPQPGAAMPGELTVAAETPTPAESSTPAVVMTAAADPAAPSSIKAPAAVHASIALNTLEDVIAFGQGRGAEALHGTLENTALFEIIRDNL